MNTCDHSYLSINEVDLGHEPDEIFIIERHHTFGTGRPARTASILELAARLLLPHLCL